MKKIIVTLVLILSCCMSACSSEKVSEKPTPADDDGIRNEVTEMSESVQSESEDEEKKEMEANNKAMIVEALGVDEENENIGIIMDCLDTINAGKLKSVEATEYKGENVLNIVTEDEIEYRFYLTCIGTVDAVENVTTGEWPIMSVR